jgi:hypothetical protein
MDHKDQRLGRGLSILTLRSFHLAESDTCCVYGGLRCREPWRGPTKD